METKVTRVTQMPGIVAPGNDEACLVQIYGPMLGKKFVLEKDETSIGRGDNCEIVLELDNVSRRHCSLLQKPDGVFLRDNGSTNGTYLNNVEIRGETPLRSGDLIKVGGAIFKFLFGGELGSIEAQYHEEIYRLTIIDGLTQVYNKRYLLEFLDREMARCARHGRALSLVLLDIDHFKKINDTYGHLAGDYVLRELASALKSRIRKEECFARYGGEEFALVLPETGHENTVFLADKLRKIIEQHQFVFEGKHIPVTFSAGVADLEGSHDNALAFIKAADARLYEAKRRGRNQVVGA
ncbi:MAG: GGDEF domain-containing protein [Myxococcales bacterium]|nr:GGDEF domain-containing protein [Myxococcales bacterium]